MGAGGPEGSGRGPRLDPFALPVRFFAPDHSADGQIRQIELDRKRVVMRRSVRGIPMKVGVPISAFRGVSLHMVLTDAEYGASFAVVLDHRDSGLSVPLFVANDGDEGVALWKSWGQVLDLPLLLADGDGTVREPFPHLGAVIIGRPTPRRRRRAALKWRRPSILMRRKPGRPSAETVVHRGEREIIARN
ncbi:MAG TPA: DUF6101 family protein [Xanthobacteraceae bacterium]|nr:DUF6101 family protein [Xanthobacteraceae bacterium]